MLPGECIAKTHTGKVLELLSGSIHIDQLKLAINTWVVAYLDESGELQQHYGRGCTGSSTTTGAAETDNSSHYTL